MRVVALLLFVGCAATHQKVVTTAPPADVLVFTNANVIDGVASEPLRDVTVVLRAGRIITVSAGGDVPADATTIIDLRGRWLLPGLIDAHVHLRDLASARAALRAGVTTARSLGVDHFTDLRIRDLHRSGVTDVPDVVGAGYHVRRRLADALFLDFPELLPLKDGVSGSDDVRAVVGALAKHGVDVIKVMATERAGVADTDFRRRVLDDAELMAAVSAARDAGLAVAAHAHTDEAANAALRAGVRTVEHGTLVSASTLALMKQRDVCFVSTLSFWRDMAEPGGEYDSAILAERAREMFPRARAAAALASSIGVTVATGSDMRYDAESPFTVVDEIVELTRSGIKPMSAIMAATSAAALCIGVAART
jgi:imidazolonepropionase-like amidohydrolase